MQAITGMDVTSPDNRDTSVVQDTPRYGVDIRRALLVYVAGVAALFAVFRETVFSFFPIWDTSSFGHGYLIVPISLFLFWLNRRHILAVPVRPSLVGLGLLAVVAIGWGLGEIADVNIVRQAALVGMIQCLFLAVLGWPAFRAAIFPFGYLLFAVPFGGFLIPYLQDVTAWFAVSALDLLGVPVFNDGVFIQTPAGNYLVAEACSGSRYLLSTLAVSVLASGLFFTSWTKRLAFVGAGVIVSIAANAVRAGGVILLAYWVDPSLAGPVHITYGLIFVAIITLIYLMVGSSFKERSIGEYAEPRTATAPGVQRVTTSMVQVVVIAAVGILGTAAITAYIQYALSQSAGATVGTPGMPEIGAPWHPAESDAVAWRPNYVGVDTVATQMYRDRTQSAEIYIGLYAKQNRGAELINQTNSIEGDSWERASSGQVDITLAKHRLTASYVRLLPKHRFGDNSETSGRVVWYWYWVGGRFTASPIWAKVLEVKAVLLGQSHAAAIVAISAGYKDDPSDAVKTLRDFCDKLGSLEPGLLGALKAPPNRSGS